MPSGKKRSRVNANTRERVTKRINRVAGQVGGVQRMLADDRYCVDMLNQIAAIRSALDAVGLELIAAHLESCVMGHGTGSEHNCAKPMKKEDLLMEVQAVLKHFLK